MRTIAALVLLGVVAATSGCARVQPWVKPYERERLANPVMAWDRDPVSTGFMDHVREIREGARGGTGAAGGGCGCN